MKGTGFYRDDGSMVLHGPNFVLHKDWEIYAGQNVPAAAASAGWGSYESEYAFRVKKALSAVGEEQPFLPDSGLVRPGEIYRYGEDELWSVIQSFDRSVYGEHPSAYPALIRRLRNPYIVSEWRQPIDQFDAYKLFNPFTGLPDRALYNGQRWRVSQADAAGNNVWTPGVFGWTLD